MATSVFPNRTYLGWILPLVVVVTSCAYPWPRQVAEGAFEDRLSVAGPLELEVRSGSGGIEIRTGEVGTVHVTGAVRARASTVDAAAEKVSRLEAEPPITKAGNTVRIGHIADRSLRRNVSIRYVITVPEEASVRASVGSGRIAIDGVTGPVEGQTGSGRVTVTHIERGVSARSGSGRIDLDAVTGNVDVKTGSGRIELARLSGGLTATTGSGGISVDGQPSDEWVLRTGSGSVNVTLPQDFAFDVSARSGSGGVTVDHPVTTTGRMRRNSLEGTVRGGGVLVAVKTGSGAIRIE